MTKLRKQLLTKLYVIPNYECNLNCPHCDLHKKKVTFNEDLFYATLNSIEADEVILFGGEPTLYKDRLLACLETNKVTSISTNLLDEDRIDLFTKYDLDIATSWNPHRFNKFQQSLWINNLYHLSKLNKQALILITLTPDLLKFSKEDLYNLFNTLEILGISGILFEPLVSSHTNQEFYNKCDNWLCELYKDWRWGFNNFIIDKLDNWNCNCSGIKTLEPNGILKNGCPQVEGNIQINNRCFSCFFSSICNPCYLQKYCAFPKNLYKLVKEK